MEVTPYDKRKMDDFKPSSAEREHQIITLEVEDSQDDMGIKASIGQKLASVTDFNEQQI